MKAAEKRQLEFITEFKKFLPQSITLSAADYRNPLKREKVYIEAVNDAQRAYFMAHPLSVKGVVKKHEDLILSIIEKRIIVY